MTPALFVEGLSKTYQNGTFALRNIHLRIEPGEIVAILGPNGAGKSTLINIIAQVLKISAGRVEIFGIPIDLHSERAKMALGVTPQEIALDPFFTARELLVNHSGYYGVRNNGLWIDHLLDKLGLASHANKKSRELSGGMRRRLTIAKALVHRPPLLILDEPTAGVDVELRLSLWDFVRELHQQGTTVILTTHYLEEAQNLAQRIAIMRQGIILAFETSEHLLENFGGRYFEVCLRGSDPLPPGTTHVENISNGVRVRGDFSMDHAHSLLSWLAAENSRIQDIRIDREGLEDVFLKLTKS